jgi:hypothetical protein
VNAHTDRRVCGGLRKQDHTRTVTDKSFRMNSKPSTISETIVCSKKLNKRNYQSMVSHNDGIRSSAALTLLRGSCAAEAAALNGSHAKLLGSFRTASHRA